MSDKTKEVFFVSINDSHEVRKAILKASKEIIIVLQRYEMFKRLREAKLKLMEELSKEFKEIHEIVSQMKIDMPKSKFSTTRAVGNVMEMRERGASVSPASSTSIQEDEELQKLEASIAEIEKKLQHMQ